MKSILSTRQIKYAPVWLWSIFAGLLLCVGIVFPYAGPLSLVGVYICINILLATKSLWQALYLGWLAWLVKGLIVLSFLLSVYPVTSFPIENIGYHLGLILWSWFMPALALSFGGVVFAGLLYGIQKSFQSKIIIILTVPIAWLFSEVAGSISYSIITIGSGSSLQAYFSMGYIGYALADIPGYISWGSIAGVYGLGVLAILLVMLWSMATTSDQRKLIISGVFLLSIIGFGISKNAHIPTDTPKVLTIDTSFSANSLQTKELVTQRATVLAEAVSEAYKHQPDYILLPEDSRYLATVYNSEDIRQAYALYRFLNSTTSASVIDSARTAVSSESDKMVLRSFIFSSNKTPIMSDKKYLTPQGEYLPYLTELLVRATGNGSALKHPSLGAYVRGGLATPAQYTGPVVLFCFESINPTAVRSLLRQQNIKPPFVAHLVSHAWFNLPVLLTHQLDTILRVQAVWNNVTIISAGNKAIGKTYLPNGEMTINQEVAHGEGWVVRKSRY